MNKRAQRLLSFGSTLLLLLLLAASASPAHAIQRAEARTHDDIYARLSVGPGYTTLLSPDRGSRYRAYGATVSIEASIGGEVAEDLLLHVTAVHWSMLLPSYTVDGSPVSGSGGRASAVAVGPGFTYYIMPWNIFASLSIGLGRMFMTKPAQQVPDGGPPFAYASATGWMVHITAGKEWWVDEQWLLGAAAFLAYSTFPEPGGLPVWGGPTFGARMTVTYD